MKTSVKNKELKEFLKFQEGGEMPAPEEAGGSPEEQIIQPAMQVVETQDAQLALQVCQAIVEMDGVGAQEAPMAPEGQAPVYRKGGKLSRWISK